MLRRPLSDAEIRSTFERVLAGIRAGSGGVPTGVGLDDVVEAALWAVVVEPDSDLVVQAARDALEGQISGANARAAALAQRGGIGPVSPSGPRSAGSA